MDDSTFDDLFSDKLREEQEFDYREEDWAELSDRLEDKPKRKWGWLFFAAGLFMAASIAMNIWQAWNLQKIQGEVSTLQDQVYGHKQTIESLHAKHAIQLSEQVIKSELLSGKRDTVYKTIYKTIIKEKEIPVYIYPENNTNSKNGILSNTKISAPPLGVSSNPSILNTPAKIASNLIGQNFLSKIASAPLLPLATIDRTLTLSFPKLEKDAKDKIIKPAFKKKWRLGPSVAYSRVPNKCIDQRNQHFGLDLNVDLSKKWTLESSFSYNQIKNTCPINQPIDTSSLFVPSTNLIINSKNTNVPLGQIQNIKSEQKYLQISLGAKYHFSKRFYFGAHILGYRFLQREIIINAPSQNLSLEESFQNPAVIAQVVNNYDITYDSFFKNNSDRLADPTGDAQNDQLRKPGFLIDRMEVTAGTTFNIKNKYQIPVELFYQRNLNVAQFSLPPLVGLRASFLFKL